MDSVESTTTPELRAKLLLAVEQLARRGGQFSANEIWVEAGETPTRALGPIMVQLAKAGKIRQIGRTGDMARKESHGQSVSIWTGDGEWLP